MAWNIGVVASCMARSARRHGWTGDARCTCKLQRGIGAGNRVGPAVIDDGVDVILRTRIVIDLAEDAGRVVRGKCGVRAAWAVLFRRIVGQTVLLLESSGPVESAIDDACGIYD